MKTPFWLSCAALFVLSHGIESCDSYSDLVADSLPSATFISSSLSVAESAGEQFITISLDKPVRADGHIVVKVLSLGDAPVSTIPAIKEGIIKLPISAGRSLANLTLLPLDNKKMDGTRKVSLSLLSVDGFYEAGRDDLSMVTIADDESPSLVEFVGREGSFSEKETNGYQVELRLSAPAPAAGIVIVEAKTDCRYSSDFFSVPSVVNSKFYLPVAEGQTAVSLKIYPVNDAIRRDDRKISFQVIDAAGGVMQDGSSAGYQLWIVEDDINASLIPAAPTIESEK